MSPDETPIDAPATLRDHLAVKRTQLANERTMLAYGRTALMLVASGATLLKIGPTGPVDLWLGWAAIVAGAGVAIVGGWRFHRSQTLLGGH